MRSVSLAAQQALERARRGGACEVCHCTERRACPGGCAWDETMLLKGRLVCTRCIEFPPASVGHLVTR